MKLVRSFVVDAPPERVGAALCSEAFNVAAERERPEVLSSRFEVLERGEDSLLFELRSTEYKRKKTGGLDRSGTVESVTRHTWSEPEQTLSWEYRGAGSRWVTVAGVYRLTPSGAATHVLHDITIEVHVPLLGGAIAKLIAREFDAAADRFQRLLTRHSTAT